MKTIIVAHDLDRAIGRDGGKPWIDRMAVDKRHFRRMTLGNTILAGANTLRLLPPDYWSQQNRQTIGISTTMEATDEYEIARNIPAAYAMARHSIMIIGGGQIFEQTIDDADVVLATQIESSGNDGDTFFPALPEDVWRLTASASYPRDERNEYPFTLARYVRRSPKK